MGGFPEGGAIHWGMSSADGGAAGVQMGGVADPGPPPAQPAMPWSGPSTSWYAGQYTPATYTSEGVVATWKLVKVGDISPWDQRVAHALQAEWKRLQQGERQVSRDDRVRRQVWRGLVHNYRDDRFCAYRKFISDDRSDQHQLGHSRQIGALQ
eukprot:4826718-Heterocapsa_arctica.AAC.1